MAGFPPHVTECGWKADIALTPCLCPTERMLRAKRSRRREGDILKVDVGGGKHAYAQVGHEPIIVFFEGLYEVELTPTAVAELPALFRLMVMNHAVTSGQWPVVGHEALSAENAEEPFFFKQDQINGSLALYHSSFANQNYERPATLAECSGLECAAVWEPEHVCDRLRDRHHGKRNRWADELAIRSAPTP